MIVVVSYSMRLRLHAFRSALLSTNFSALVFYFGGKLNYSSYRKLSALETPRLLLHRYALRQNIDSLKR